MNNITQITRRNIFDSLRLEKIDWHGRLDETEFLSRIYDLSKMPSHDDRFGNMAGDIWQHRVNNYDWEDDWVLFDERLNLMQCDDGIFLNFLCEMLHPIVRADVTEVPRLQQTFNDHLRHDNFELVEKTRISNRPVFIGRQMLLERDRLKSQKPTSLISYRMNMSPSRSTRWNPPLRMPRISP